MEWAQRVRMRRFDEPILIQIYSEVLQTFRLAAQGKRPGRQPPAHLRERIERYFDPLPFYYAPLEARGDRPRALSARRGHAAADGDVPLVGLAERVAAPDPRAQLPLRQSAAPRARPASPTAAGCGSSRRGARCAAWRAIAKRSSRRPCGRGTRSARRPARGGSRRTPNESQRGFLLNHLITEELPGAGATRRISNSDPITGQAGWYDVRVRISPARPRTSRRDDVARASIPMPALRRHGRRRALRRRRFAATDAAARKDGAR